jgi:hypothetical protein
MCRRLHIALVIHPLALSVDLVLLTHFVTPASRRLSRFTTQVHKLQFGPALCVAAQLRSRNPRALASLLVVIPDAVRDLHRDRPLFASRLNFATVARLGYVGSRLRFAVNVVRDLLLRLGTPSQFAEKILRF